MHARLRSRACARTRECECARAQLRAQMRALAHTCVQHDASRTLNSIHCKGPSPAPDRLATRCRAETGRERCRLSTAPAKSEADGIRFDHVEQQGTAAAGGVGGKKRSWKVEEVRSVKSIEERRIRSKVKKLSKRRRRRKSSSYRASCLARRDHASSPYLVIYDIEAASGQSTLIETN
eukprot:6202011-Pleurochrysis_carterae.AAC.1